MISKWVTEDSVSLDKLPYIGQFSSLMPNMYVATGFKKWYTIKSPNHAKQDHTVVYHHN